MENLCLWKMHYLVYVSLCKCEDLLLFSFT